MSLHAQDVHVANGSHRKVVLYVEDNPVNVLLMQALFVKRPALHLVVANSGQEALQMVQGLSPSLLMLDLRLPDCHGGQLLQVLRGQPACRHTAAVVVTAEAAFELRGTGFSELWSKPLNLAQVLGRLDVLTQGDEALVWPALADRLEQAVQAARAWH